MPHEGGGHKTYFQSAIGFLLGDEGSNLNRPVPRAVGEKHINDLLGRHPFHPYDPSIDDSIQSSSIGDVVAVDSGSSSIGIVNGGEGASSPTAQSTLISDVTQAVPVDIDAASTTPQALAALDKKFIDHAWACLRRKEQSTSGGGAESDDAETGATAGAGSYLNLPYLTHPQDHPCYTQNKLFGMCMRDDDKSEMELFMKHVNCFHPYKVDLMKCITRHTRTDRLQKQKQQDTQQHHQEGGSSGERQQ